MPEPEPYEGKGEEVDRYTGAAALCQYIKDWHYFLKDLEEQILKAGGQEDGSQGSGFSEQKAKEISMSLLGRFYMTPYLPDRYFYEQFYERLNEAKKEF